MVFRFFAALGWTAYIEVDILNNIKINRPLVRQANSSSFFARKVFSIVTQDRQKNHEFSINKNRDVEFTQHLYFNLMGTIFSFSVALLYHLNQIS